MYFSSDYKKRDSLGQEGFYNDILYKRDYIQCDQFGNCEPTTWSNWGRWVALVAVITALFFLFLTCAIFSARHRRMRGQYPLWGTGWVPVYKYNNGPYDPHASTHQPVDPNPAPPYSPPPYTANSNYYGPPMPPHQQQQQQYEMQGGNTSGNNEQYFQQDHTGQHFQTLSSPPPAHLLGGRKDNI